MSNNVNQSIRLARPGVRPFRIVTALAALWLGTSAWAQIDAPPPPAAVEPPSEAELDALRGELDRARKQLTEAARKMAEIQRQLGETQNQTHIVFSRHGDNMAELGEQIEKLRFGLSQGLGGMRPRLGVLLGGSSLEENQDPRTVIGITPGSGAEMAGIRRGDVLVRVKGLEISENGVAGVREALADAEPGQAVSVEALRDGKRVGFEVELGSPGQDIRMIVRRLGDGSNIGIDGPAMDIDVESVLELVGDVSMPPIPTIPLLSSAARLPRLAVLGDDIDLVSNHAGLEPYFGTAEGVLVLRVEQDNAFGLRAGDVILNVDRAPITSPVALGRMLLDRDAGNEITLEVMRDGVLTELSGVVPEHEPLGPNARKDLSWIQAPRAPKPPARPPVIARILM